MNVVVSINGQQINITSTNLRFWDQITTLGTYTWTNI